MSKRKKILIGILIFSTLIVLGFYFSFVRGFYAGSDKVVGEYHSTGSMEKFQQVEEWKYGVNKYGEPVFTDYKKALAFTKEEYSDVIDRAYDLFSEEYELGELDDKNFGLYMNLIHQMPAENEVERKRNVIVAQFFDIYENSLKRWIYVQGLGWERICP